MPLFIRFLVTLTLSTTLFVPKTVAWGTRWGDKTFSMKKYAMAPDKVSGNLTPYKKYEILWQNQRKGKFKIKDDKGLPIFCEFKSCTHIACRDWLVLNPLELFMYNHWGKTIIVMVIMTLFFC